MLLAFKLLCENASKLTGRVVEAFGESTAHVKKAVLTASDGERE